MDENSIKIYLKLKENVLNHNLYQEQETNISILKKIKSEPSGESTPSQQICPFQTFPRWELCDEWWRQSYLSDPWIKLNPHALQLLIHLLNKKIKKLTPNYEPHSSRNTLRVTMRSPSAFGVEDLIIATTWS